MSKNSNRHQSVITRQSDNESDDHWLKAFENNLQKGAVQPYSNDSVFEQINSIMNGKSKYTSVQNAVESMLERSGYKMLADSSSIKVSEKDKCPKKTAQSNDPVS